jgi:hypothetical protein
MAPLPKHHSLSAAASSASCPSFDCAPDHKDAAAAYLEELPLSCNCITTDLQHMHDRFEAHAILQQRSGREVLGTVADMNAMYMSSL